MHYVMRLALALAITAVFPLRAAPEAQAEYKQADSSYYLRSDLFSADPAALIAAPEAATNMGSTYLVSTRGKAPAVVYLQQTHDWIEPITPPSEPTNLNISPTDMEVREPLGSVQVALPGAPSDFRNVEPGQVLPNGAVLRTGDNGSVAVLFGGVDSVRLAPNSQAAVQMNLAKGTRDVEIDIRGGMAFSKVGSRPGEKQAYKVHTPFGDAAAHGTDYVTVVYPARVDVWVAQGTVELAGPNGPRQVTVSTGKEPLKVMRNPAAKDATTALVESAESLTALLNFIPMANQKLHVLASRTQSGANLTATEKDYVGRIRKVVSLIKLANVDAPPVPAVASVPEPPSPPEHRAPATTTIVSHEKASPRALPVEPQPVVAAMPAQKPALRALPVEPPSSVPLVKAAYKTKPVVIVLPPAHFPKLAPETDLPTVVAAKSPKALPLKADVVNASPPATPEVAKPSAKTNEGTKTASASKSASVAKAKPVATAATSTKPSPEKHYLRAKLVDPAELAAAPAVKNAPPAPLMRSHAEVDPNSLGAPLNPMLPMHPIVEPRAPQAEVTKAVRSPAQPAAEYSVP